MELELDRNAPSLDRDERSLKLTQERELELQKGNVSLEAGYEKFNELTQNNILINSLSNDELTFLKQKISETAYLKSGNPINISKLDYNIEYNLVQARGYGYTLSIELDKAGFEKPLAIREALESLKDVEKNHHQTVKDCGFLEQMIEQALDYRNKEIMIQEVQRDQASKGISGIWNRITGQLPNSHHTLEERPLSKEEIIHTLNISDVKTDSFLKFLDERLPDIQKDPRESIHNLKSITTVSQAQLDSLSSQIKASLNIGEKTLNADRSISKETLEQTHSLAVDKDGNTTSSESLRNASEKDDRNLNINVGEKTLDADRSISKETLEQTHSLSVNKDGNTTSSESLRNASEKDDRNLNINVGEKTLDADRSISKETLEQTHSLSVNKDGNTTSSESLRNASEKDDRNLNINVGEKTLDADRSISKETLEQTHSLSVNKDGNTTSSESLRNASEKDDRNLNINVGEKTLDADRSISKETLEQTHSLSVNKDGNTTSSESLRNASEKDDRNLNINVGEKTLDADRSISKETLEQTHSLSVNKDGNNITEKFNRSEIDSNQIDAKVNLKEQTASVTVTDDNTFKTHDQVSITDKDGTNVTATSDLDIIDNNKIEANANIKEQTASVTVTDDNTFKTHDQVSITDKDGTNITATSDLDIIDNNKIEANANIKEQTASVTVTDDNTFKTHDQVSITDKDGTNVTATSDLDIIDNNKIEANANIKEQTASVTVTDDNTFKTHDQVSITDKDGTNITATSDLDIIDNNKIEANANIKEQTASVTVTDDNTFKTHDQVSITDKDGTNVTATSDLDIIDNNKIEANANIKEQTASVTVTDDNTFKTHDEVSITDKDGTNITATSDLDIIDNNKIEANANIKEQTASVTVTDDNTFKTHDQVSITDKDGTNVTATSDLDIIDNNKIEANANIKEQTASVTVKDDNTSTISHEQSITDKDGNNITEKFNQSNIDNNQTDAKVNLKEQSASVTVTDDNTFKTHDQVSITDKDGTNITATSDLDIIDNNKIEANANIKEQTASVTVTDDNTFKTHDQVSITDKDGTNVTATSDLDIIDNNKVEANANIKEQTASVTVKDDNTSTISHEQSITDKDGNNITEKFNQSNIDNNQTDAKVNLKEQSASVTVTDDNTFKTHDQVSITDKDGTNVTATSDLDIIDNNKIEANANIKEQTASVTVTDDNTFKTHDQVSITDKDGTNVTATSDLDIIDNNKVEANANIKEQTASVTVKDDNTSTISHEQSITDKDGNNITEKFNQSNIDNNQTDAKVNLKEQSASVTVKDDNTSTISHEQSITDKDGNKVVFEESNNITNKTEFLGKVGFDDKTFDLSLSNANISQQKNAVTSMDKDGNIAYSYEYLFDKSANSGITINNQLIRGNFAINNTEQITFKDGNTVYQARDSEWFTGAGQLNYKGYGNVSAEYGQETSKSITSDGRLTYLDQSNILFKGNIANTSDADVSYGLSVGAGQKFVAPLGKGDINVETEAKANIAVEKKEELVYNADLYGSLMFTKPLSRGKVGVGAEAQSTLVNNKLDTTISPKVLIEHNGVKVDTSGTFNANGQFISANFGVGYQAENVIFRGDNVTVGGYIKHNISSPQNPRKGTEGGLSITWHFK